MANVLPQIHCIVRCAGRMAGTLQPWKVLVSEKRTFLEVSLVECQDCDCEGHCAGHENSRCGTLCRHHSEPDLLRSNSRIQERQFVVEFPSRRRPERVGSTSKTESASSVKDEPLAKLLGQTGLDVAVPLAEEASLQAFSEHLRKLAEALMQQASTMTPSATVVPSAATAPHSFSPGNAGPPSLSNVVAEAAAQAQDMARQFQLNARPPGVDAHLPPGAHAQPRKDRPESMRTYLMELKNEDLDCVLIVRKIHKLGALARTLLSEHFSQFGEVARVFVADSKVKATQGTKPMRAGNLGFIVMKSADAVMRILANGGEETIGHCQFRVQKFETRSADCSPMNEEFEKCLEMIPSCGTCEKDSLNKSGSAVQM